jgi:nucleoside-diphosphate-sugar epimerase
VTPGISAAPHRPVLVTGGTGTLGTLVVERLRNAGRQVRVLSRNTHEGRGGLEFVTGDLATGDGINGRGPFHRAQPGVRGTPRE